MAFETLLTGAAHFTGWIFLFGMSWFTGRRLAEEKKSAWGIPVFAAIYIIARGVIIDTDRLRVDYEAGVWLISCLVQYLTLGSFRESIPAKRPMAIIPEGSCLCSACFGRGTQLLPSEDGPTLCNNCFGWGYITPAMPEGFYYLKSKTPPQEPASTD